MYWVKFYLSEFFLKELHLEVKVFLHPDVIVMKLFFLRHRDTIS